MGQRHLDRGTLRRRLHARSRQQRGMKKATEAAVVQAQQASFMVCALLAQCGGSKTLTKGTLDQCMASVDKMGFKMTETPTGEYEVILLVRDTEDPRDATVPIASPDPVTVAPIVITG